MTGAAGFPAPIASALQAWETEPELFRRQARLLACFEALVQYAAIVAVSEFYRAGLDRELPDVDGLIREVIHRPSTGTWQRIYREAAGAFRTRRAALAADSLYRFGFDDAGRQQPWMRAADLITQLRNEQKGHGHVLEDEAEYRAILARHDVLLRELLDAADFARELTLCVVLERSNRGILAARLMGPVELAGPRDEFPSAADAPPPGHVAVRHGGNGKWVDLSPLLLYLECEREVERIDNRGNRTRERCGKPGVFFHHEMVPPSRVRGFEFRYAHHSSWRFPDFDFVGQYLERYGRRAGATTQAEWYNARISEAQRFFVGREEPLQQLTRTAGGGGPHRVVFVVAGPGYGKSTLLARWIARMESEGVDQPVQVCRHFIQEQYPESGRASNVFDVLRLQVCARFGLDPTPPYPDGRPRAERYRAALIEALGLAVHAASKRSVALVIDGLDEALRVVPGENEGLIDWLPGPDLLPAGVSLILSGRPIIETIPLFRARFGRNVAEYLALERLADSEVREWFELAFGAVYALEHRGFLEQVAGAASGHPQYLHFVHRALMDGSLQPGDVDQLPAGLEDFYGRVMHDAAGEQPAALRVIALLAAAAAPLDLGTLSAVLGETTDQVANACDAARNVLEWDNAGHVLLFDAEFAEWVRAGQVRSPSDALRRDTYAVMSARLLDWCRKWSTHGNPYAASNLLGHLVAAELHDEVRALARDPEFLRFQATARPDTPDLPQATFRAAVHHALQTDDHAAMAEFGLRRVAWATATLSETPLDAFHNGSLDRARRLADLHDPGDRLAWYFVLAAELVERDGVAGAESFLGLPGRLPWWPASVGVRSVWDLQSAAIALLRLLALPGFTDLWRLYLDGPARSHLATRLAALGRLDLAELIVKETPSSPERDQALIALAREVAAQGDFQRAYRFADGMWTSQARWTARTLIAEIAAPVHGLPVLDTASHEASQDSTLRDVLVRRIAESFARAGKLREAGVAAHRIENPAARDVAFGAAAADALAQRDIPTAVGFIKEIEHSPVLGRSLLDRAGVSALRRGRFAELAGVVQADPIRRRLATWLVLLAATIGGAMALLSMTDRGPIAAWGPAAWLVSALALTIGLRSGRWGAGLVALLWGALTAFSLDLLSDAGPLAVAAAMTAGGLALFVSVIRFGPDGLASSLAGRIATVTLAAAAVAGTITLLPGQRLIGWSGGSAWLILALVLPAGAALGAAAVASVSTTEERLSYHAAALLPALLLFALGSPIVRGMPIILALGWLVASTVGLLRLLPKRAEIPGVAVLFLAVAEVIRAFLSRAGFESTTPVKDVVPTAVSIAMVILLVAVWRRGKDLPAETAEHPASDQSEQRARPAITDRGHSGERGARFGAELLLRLARLFPRSGAEARQALHHAATRAAALSTAPGSSGSGVEPVRRDLLWQIARESWRLRYYAGSARAAWLVEWRRWSGMIAAASALATGALGGAYLRWILPLELSDVSWVVPWAAMGTIAGLTVAVTTLRLRSLREPLLSFPLTVGAASWILWGGQDLNRLVPVVLVILLLSAIGAPGSGSMLGWLGSLGLLWRRQVLIAIPGGFLVAGLLSLILGAPWMAAKDVFLRPTGSVLVLGVISTFIDAAAKRLVRPPRLLKRARDLPPLPDQGGDVAALERGTFSEDVGAAVVRLAERQPSALGAIARAATSVR